SDLSLRSKVYADFRYKKIFQHSLLKVLEVILPYGFRKSLFEIIKKAAHTEFLAYKKLPVINLSNLNTYFTQKGSARKRIVHLLGRHKQRGWVLNNPLNPSTFEILNIKLKKIEDKISTVETEEYWYLRWFSKIDGKYKFIYDERNLQTYKMKKDKNGFWKVDINIYPSKEYIG
ncbi:MAG TPA: hypothetical protein DCQ58_05325, partial [Saprospirales bacterium]|nr:hypothetical protein [Saprospirales bacterium]